MGATTAAVVADTRTLSWLRWRESAAKRNTATLVVSTLAAATAAVVVAALVAVSVSWDLIGIPTDTLVGPLWVFLVIGPIFGGGSAETSTVAKLGAHPLQPAAVFISACLSAGSDMPYMIAAPMVFGAAYGTGGLTAILAAGSFLWVAVLCGQLGASAWLSLAARNRHLGAAVVIAITAGLALVAVVARHVAADALRWPGRLLLWGCDGGAHAGALFGAAVVGTVFGVALGANLVRRFARSSKRTRSGRRTPVFVPGGAPGAWLASMRRSVSVQMTFLTLSAAGLFPVLTARQPLRLSVVLGVTTLGVVSILGVNLWSLCGGGITVLLAAPTRGQVAAPFLALVTLTLFANAVVAGVALAAGTRDNPVTAAVSAASNVSTLCAFATWMSLRHASAADWDSLRVRPAAPGATFRFAATLAVLLWVPEVALGGHSAGSQAARVSLGALISVLFLCAASRRVRSRPALAAAAGGC